MTLEQIAMMAAAAKVLKEGGAHSVDLWDRERPRVHIRQDAMASVIADGRAIEVAQHGTDKWWAAAFTVAEVVFFALYGERALPQIGYRLVDGRPVPITEEVR